MSTRADPKITLYDDHGNTLTVPDALELLECCRTFHALGVDKIIHTLSESDVERAVSLACEAHEEFFAACKWLSESQNREPIATEQVMFLRARSGLRCLFTDAVRHPTNDRSIAQAFEHFAMVAIMIVETAHTKLSVHALSVVSHAR